MPIRFPLTRTALASALLCLLGASNMAMAAAYAPPEAQVHRAAAGQSLVQAPGGARAAAVGQVLRQRGASEAAVQSLVEVSSGAGNHGVTHVRLEQRVGGLAVYGSSVKAAFNSQGDLVQVVERVAPVGAAAPRAARINERQALDAAMARVHPAVKATFVSGARAGASQSFAGGAFFHNDPEVTRVLVPQADGSLAQGFLVQTWTQRGNLLDHTLVDGDGAVLNVERRTANDSYNIFPVDPGKGPQVVTAGPGAGNTESPSGWLAGTQTTWSIKGNNANAYLDADANNRADSGGTSVTTGNFLTAANLTLAPTTTGNKAVAVQNLFYLVNRIHDVLYRHGFNEAAGNFQVNNFGKGGSGKDPVNAEAQDGSGTDNANMSTPSDGRSPRMQMYLWTGTGPTHEVVLASGPNYAAMGSSFGAQLTTTGLAGTVVLGNDGVAASGGGTVNDGCEALPKAAVQGKIVLLDRGLCNFTVKVKNAQVAGATGVIIANNSATAIFAGGGTDSTVTIPSVMISQADGSALRGLSAPSATMRKKAVQPLQLDGDLDSDIVYHEYGHGLTWRMIGGMSGPLAGAIGEGASDVVSFMVNGDDIVGEYAMSNSLGIRRYRYAGYPLTYGNVTGAEVHDDGEIYAAAMWRLRELWLGSGRSNDTLFGHFVDGMNYTPSTPKFEDMRNGMLDAIRVSVAGAEAPARCALVWQAFAQYGIGDGAKGTVVSSTSVTIVPSTAARSDCTH